MIEKFRTGVWFLRRPDHWTHAAALIARKLRSDHDSPELRNKARDWAGERAVSVQDALVAIGLLSVPTPVPELSAELLEEARGRTERSTVRMGDRGT